MIRYLRLYLYFIRFSFSKAMEFRFDFFFRVFMDCAFYAMQFGFYKVLFLQTPIFADWQEHQVLLFIAGFILTDALHMTLFSNNMHLFPLNVNQGKLDYDLVRPVSSLFIVSLRDFAANSFVNLIITIAIFSTLLWTYPEPFAFSQLLVYVVLLINGTFLIYIMQMILSLSVFWTHSAESALQFHHSVYRFAERPDGIFSGVTRKIFLTILPVSLIASFPVRTMFDGISWQVVGHCFLVSCLLFALLIFLWGKGLKAYSSASS